jgi:hypothetical protein
MLFWVEIELSGALWPTPSDRYEILSRVSRILRGAGVTWYGFSLYAGRLRLVVEGDVAPLTVALNHIAGGTLRAARALGRIGRVEHRRREVDDLFSALVLLHRAPGPLDPLCYPWTSYRDLLGFRYANFFDPSPALARVDVERLRIACGGGPIDEAPAREPAVQQDLLYPLSASIQGVVPADRKCFRLYAHLSRVCGVPTDRTARTLGLTPRRVSQMLAEPEPLLPIGLRAASDRRLHVVP